MIGAATVPSGSRPDLGVYPRKTVDVAFRNCRTAFSTTSPKMAPRASVSQMGADLGSQHALEPC